METAKITIDKIYENEAPAPSKIIDTVGGEWKVFKDVFDQLNFKRQATYEVKYKDGKPFKGKIDKIIQSAVAQAAESQSNGQGAAQEYSRARTNPVDSDRMGTMGMVNAFISIGAVAADAEAIGNLIKKCRDGLHKGWAE